MTPSIKRLAEVVMSNLLKQFKEGVMNNLMNQL